MHSSTHQESSRSRRIPASNRSSSRSLTNSNIWIKLLDSLQKHKTWTWVSLIFVIFTTTGSISPPHQPFNCNDVSIQKEFHGDSISIVTLFLIILLVPPIVFGVTEAFHAGSLTDRTKRRKFFSRLGILCNDYLLGVLYVITIIELGKTLVGELRPHFIDTCRPDWKKINCSAGPVKEYTCTGKGPDWLVKRDIYKSFPSGHAALSFYFFVFISMYSQVRIPRSQYSHLFRSWIQLVGLALAMVCSLSRITDNRHHWWDVLTGSILGIVGAYFTVQLIVQNKFIPKKDEDGPSENSETILAPMKINNDKMTSL